MDDSAFGNVLICKLKYKDEDEDQEFFVKLINLFKYLRARFKGKQMALGHLSEVKEMSEF